MMQIRLMTPDDYDDVYALWTSIDGMGLRNLDDSRNGIARFLARNPTTCFVADVDGRVVGCILCGTDGRRAYIYHTAVLAEHRGKGIGKALVEHVYDALHELGIAKAALLVYADNETGNAFWQALGWEVRTDVLYRNKLLDGRNV